ncbi:MAG: PAS domain S-box protein, partial [Verrucomicrobiota bacterium]
FIRKPFSDAELSACLEAAIERDTSNDSLSQRIPGLEAVADQVSQGIVAADLDGRVHYMNRAAEKLTGWSRSEGDGEAFEDVVPLEEIENSENSASEEQQRPRPRRMKLTSRSGESREVEERSAPIKSEGDEVVGLVTILAAAGSGSSSEKGTSGEGEAQVTSLADLETPRDLDGDVPPARANAVRKIAALSRDPAFRKMIGKRDTPPLKPSDPESPAPEKESSIDLSDPTVTQPVFSAAGSPLIDDVGDPLVRVDEDDRITYANSEAIAVFGNGNNLAGLSFWDRFSNQAYEQYQASFHRPLQERRSHRFDFHDTKRGRWYEARVYPSANGILALFSDITSRKLETAEGVRQQRLEGLGLLARGFAHDFNNALTAITGNISLAKERQPDDADLQQMLSEAQRAAIQATGLVQQLMTFAQGGRPIRKSTRISDLVRRILTEQRITNPEIRYQFQGAETELVANVDPAQISRLVENLVTNSATAMDGGGVLIVRCDRVSPEEVVALKGSHDPSGEDYLLVEVIDTGHGMDEDSIGKVFEPYFTTRKKDNASGIGLTVCESIAKAHGGFVQLQSKVGKGTIATFCAPLGLRPDESSSAAVNPSDESPPREVAPIPVSSPPIRRANGENLLVGTRILILEDDAPIRRLMAATLRRAGHEVVETKDGRETVTAYREAVEQQARFHLLICDLTIENGMGGVETMRRLTEMDPDVLAIVSSGYSDAPAMSNPSAFGFKGVLPKPYAPSELRAAVHRILGKSHYLLRVESVQPIAVQFPRYLNRVIHESRTPFPFSYFFSLSCASLCSSESEASACSSETTVSSSAEASSFTTSSGAVSFSADPSSATSSISAGTSSEGGTSAFFDPDFFSPEGLFSFGAPPCCGIFPRAMRVSGNSRTYPSEVSHRKSFRTERAPSVSSIDSGGVFLGGF